MTDDRLVKTSNQSKRESRGDERQTTEDSLSTSSERRKMFREFTQEALPTPPNTPGWHYCWLSTTNQYDPIFKRMRLGYETVKATELPEFNHLRVKSGEYEGCISINEMILFKIPQEVYQEIMEEYHHNMPLEEEERIRANALPTDKDSNGKSLGTFEDEGFKDLGARVRTPTF